MREKEGKEGEEVILWMGEEKAPIGVCPYCTDKIFDHSFAEHFDRCGEYKKWMWGETFKGDREI